MSESPISSQRALEADRSCRALVVGAVRDVPGGLKEWLAACGADPLCFADSRLALARALAEAFALVIVDAADVADEGEVFAELRARGQPGTLVCLGRGADPVEEVRALRAGVDVFVHRPLRPEHIELAVARSRLSSNGPLPLFGPLSVIPTRRAVVAPGLFSLLTEAEYLLLLFMAATPQAWRSLGAAAESLRWNLSEHAAAARLKDLVRRVRLQLGPYGTWIAFSRRRGVRLSEPQ